MSKQSLLLNLRRASKVSLSLSKAATPEGPSLDAALNALTPAQRRGILRVVSDMQRFAPGMPTEDISLISHTHGRERRAERNIQRKELQAAIKYGTKERANPGRDNSTRWRYTYDGVVYITDETSRHEVTSWRIDGLDAEAAMAPAEVELGGKGMHAVLIIDMSASMRNADVPGFSSRAAAVYHALLKDFAEEQVKSGAAKDVVVTVILMHASAHVELDKVPLDAAFVTKLEGISTRRPRSHGNYLPSLDKALAILSADAPSRASVLLMLLSDGAPSDAWSRECACGIRFSKSRQEPLMGHPSKAKAYKCRTAIHTAVKSDCVERVRAVGRAFGRDKAVLCTVGFGRPDEDFKVLQEMADALPRGSFQKLGLNASGLRTVFSSLSSSMTELRTEGGGRSLTQREDKVVDKHQEVQYSDKVKGSDGWWIYSHEEFTGKFAYDLRSKELRPVPPEVGATGMAFMQQPFASGAERFVYRCTEIQVPGEKRDRWYDQPWERYDKDSMRALRRGLRLVCKEAKDKENFNKGKDFLEPFARIQTDAAALADVFNHRVRGPRHWNISFLPVSLYLLVDENYPKEEAWVLAEPELEGKFTKWNNNAGAVLQVRAPPLVTRSGGALGIVEEEDEEEEEIDVYDVPQAFSHFTYEASGGTKLVCDLQGTWNEDDGFQLTDPVVHYVSSSRPDLKHQNGATDKGRAGAVSATVCAPASASSHAGWARLGVTNELAGRE